MSTSREEALAHEQARLLAAEAVDAELAPEEAEWLEAHLAACDACLAVADQYAAIHAELSGLVMPEPPRDLWVRTQAALDAVESGARRSSARQSSAGSRSLAGSSIAVAAVVLLAGAALLSQTPIAQRSSGGTSPAPIAYGSPTAAPENGAQAPLAVVNGTTYWISGSDGVYQIMGDTSTCDPADTTCTVNGGQGQTLGTIASDSEVSAALAPDASVAAVWTDDKIAILPLDDSTGTVPLDLLTPQPTSAATATPTAPPTLVPTPVPTAAPVATATPVATETIAPTEPVASPSSEIVPSASASSAMATLSAAPASVEITPVPATPTPVPATPTPPPATPAPTATATPQSNGGALAILSGYEVVGRDPEFSADGRTVAFSARPSDHSAGPDVFVWQSGDLQAHPITSAHSDYFSGWFGSGVLVSEISAGTSAIGAASPAPGAVASVSYLFDPDTDLGLRITRPMFMPVVDPTGRFVVYWSGSVDFDPTTGLWQPGAGDLYFDKWSDLELVDPNAVTAPASPTPAGSSMPEASPSASAEVVMSASPTAASPADTLGPVAPDLATPSPVAGESTLISTPEPSASPTPPASPEPTTTPPLLPQLLPVAQNPRAVQTWQVRWDKTGLHVAIWVANKDSSKVGQLSLFSVDRTAERVDIGEPLLAAQQVMSNIQFDSAHLVYTLATDGKTYMQAIPALQPSTVATATPSGSTQPGESPTAPSTDRPGN
jgi:hypothetical protein